MTKVSIEIDDIGDRAACVHAIRKLFTTIVNQYGYPEATHIWLVQPRDLKVDRAWAFVEAQSEFNAAFFSLSRKERLLVLEYYDVAQSKRGHGKTLAAKNNAKATSVIRQIRRVFSEHPEACRIIGEAPPEWRRRWASLRMPRRRVTKPRA